MADNEVNRNGVDAQCINVFRQALCWRTVQRVDSDTQAVLVEAYLTNHSAFNHGQNLVIHVEQNDMLFHVPQPVPVLRQHTVLLGHYSGTLIQINQLFQCSCSGRLCRIPITCRITIEKQSKQLAPGIDDVDLPQLHLAALGNALQLVHNVMQNMSVFADKSNIRSGNLSHPFINRIVPRFSVCRTGCTTAFVTRTNRKSLKIHAKALPNVFA
mmetsp:Transcript_41448/g.68215  ORF Transcript_41448/g.68215 Transcript_41448/m.68215 type:complete len:213 (+) Transcript_41448:723-1361(+)